MYPARFPTTQYEQETLAHLAAFASMAHTFPISREEQQRCAQAYLDQRYGHRPIPRFYRVHFGDEALLVDHWQALGLLWVDRLEKRLRARL